MRKFGMVSHLLTARNHGTEGVVTLRDVGLNKTYAKAYRRHARARQAFAARGYADIRSVNLFDYGLASVVNRWDCDVVQMHWVGNAFVPVQELAKIRKPAIWKLPDMWAFSGAEHYRVDIEAERHIRGYEPIGGAGRFWRRDLDVLAWRAKQRHWKDLPLTIVTPSRWLGREAYMSQLFRDYDVHVIPNALDTDLYSPVSPRQKARIRGSLGLPVDRHVVAFGAFGTEDPRKGFQHLSAAIANELSKHVRPDQLCFAVIGSKEPGLSTVGDFPIVRIAQTDNQRTYARRLAAADSFVLPTEIDNLPNSVTEAMACGLPTIAFAVGGTPDQIDHHESGYLVPPFESSELAKGIAWAVNQEGHDERSQSARQRAVRFCDELTAVERYGHLYEDILRRARPGLSAIRPSRRKASAPPPPDPETFPENPTQSPSLNDHAAIAARKGKGRFHDSRFTMTEKTPKRIVILDPASVRIGDTSHNATYVQTISATLANKSDPDDLSIDWVVNADAALNNPHGEVLPLFRYSPYDAFRQTRDANIDRPLAVKATGLQPWTDCIGKPDRTVFDVLQEADRQLGGLGSGDCIFVPMLDFPLLDGLINWLCARGTLFTPTVHIMVMYEHGAWMTGGYPFGNMMARLRRSHLVSHKIFLYTETKAFGDVLKERFGLDSERLVYPVERSQEAAKRLKAGEVEQLKHMAASGDRIRIAVLGRGRRDKGFALLPDIVEAFNLRSNQTNRVDFAIQDGRAVDGLADASARLKAIGNVQLLPEMLPDAQFEAEQEAADILLLPYDQSAYKSRGSSIVWRGVANAKPLIVPTKTGLSEALTHDNGLEASGSPIAFADAIIEMIDNFPKWRQGAAEAAEAYWAAKSKVLETLSRKKLRRGEQALVIDAGGISLDDLKFLSGRGYSVLRWILVNPASQPDDAFISGYLSRNDPSQLPCAMEVASHWRVGDQLQVPELLRIILENQQVDALLHDGPATKAVEALQQALPEVFDSPTAPSLSPLAAFVRSPAVLSRPTIDLQFAPPKRNPLWRRSLAAVEKRLKPNSRAKIAWSRFCGYAIKRWGE